AIAHAAERSAWMASPHWLFGSFRLDPDNVRLWRGAQAIALTPKAFAVLHYLVTHPDRLVTKDTLLDAVWPETAISDAVVRIAIGELRRALGCRPGRRAQAGHGAVCGYQRLDDTDPRPRLRSRSVA